MENPVLTRTVRCFSNNKRWINPDIKALLKEKKRVFKSGNKEELKTVQRELRRKIGEGKNHFRKKMEDQLQQNIRVWRGLKKISGHKEPDSQPSIHPPAQPFLHQLPSSTPPGLHPSPSPSLPPPTLSLQPPPTVSASPAPSTPLASPTPPLTPPNIQPPGSNLSLSTDQVKKELRKIKARKAVCPDGISSRLLKSCTDQLCRVVEHVFNLSLELRRVPQLWKTSCVVPVLKAPHPKDLNSYRPVALTSHLDTGAAGPHPSPPPGGTIDGPATVCLPSWLRSG